MVSSRGYPTVAKLAGLARRVSFDENDLILVACERSKHFYLLQSGSVCVEVRTSAYAVCVQVLGTHDAFGWSSLLGEHDTLFQVRARERCVALCLDGEDLSAAFRDDAQLGAEILRRALKLVAGRVRATEARFAEFCGMRIGKIREQLDECSRQRA